MIIHQQTDATNQTNPLLIFTLKEEQGYKKTNKHIFVFMTLTVKTSKQRK